MTETQKWVEAFSKHVANNVADPFAAADADVWAWLIWNAKQRPVY